MRLVVFPIAFMANTFAMMIVMIGLSIFGKSKLAADLGLIHGATVALFYSFSGNARSLILAGSDDIKAPQILRLRLLIVLPLSIIAWILCVGIVDGSWLFIVLMIARRGIEWLTEIFLSDQELQNDHNGATRFLIFQGSLSLILLFVLIDGGPLVMPVTLVWALSPLFGCLKLELASQIRSINVSLFAGLRLLLPHFGSTVVIGVSVYVFRLFIMLVSDKQTAGDLFSAFAIGGILGAVFAHALGPTMVRHEQSSAQPRHLLKFFNLILAGALINGVLLGLSVWFIPGLMRWTLKTDLFWLAISSSLVGGVVMVTAQRIRLRIIQENAGEDVFGSDMLSNLILLASIPVLFYGFGVEALASLYLLGAMLSWIFYASERNGLFSINKIGVLGERNILLLIAFAILTPLFFQFKGGIFDDISGSFDSGRVLALLPIPVSVLGCYLGIVLLGGYSKARLSLVSLFFVFIGMLLSSLLLGLTQEEGRQKLILLIQYILPMFALVLGQQFGSRKEALVLVARVALILLLCILPLQLITTLIEGNGILSPSIYMFSIYQHLHYVSFLFIAAFVLTLFTLWGYSTSKYWLYGLALLIGAYVVFSWSLLTILMLVCGIILFVAQQYALQREPHRALTVLILTLIGAILAIIYLQHIKNGSLPHSPHAMLSMLESRVDYQSRWMFYLDGMTEDWTTAILGHTKSPDRSLYPSALNYYFDFAYNFGLLGLFPLMLLVLYTILVLFKNLRYFWSEGAYMGLGAIVILMLSMDSAFKVGLRQPYSGVIMFFFWGLLLALITSLVPSQPKYK